MERAASTKDRILDAAERLFAEYGFSETSLRQITAEADVNLAAVNYHFQSKDSLIQAVFARRLGPLNQERLEMLDACQAAAGNGPLPLDCVLRAFVEPILKMGRQLPDNGAAFRRMLGRLYAETGDLFGRIFKEQLAGVKFRFFAAFRRALPELSPEELLWRMYFLMGALAHAIAGVEHLRVVSEGLCDPSADADSILERLIAFLSAGLRAPAPAFVTEGDPKCAAH